MNLLQVEGLSSLIQAETEAQREKALETYLDENSKIHFSWLQELKSALAYIESSIAFSEEDKNWSGSFKSSFRVILIFFANNSITNDANITLTFTANENITGFAVGDIGAIGGSLSSFSGSNATYTSTFTPSSNRNTVIYIPKEVYTDQSSNNNLNSIPFYWTYDGTCLLYTSPSPRD